MATDLGHPTAAFHREILTILHWSSIREDFCTSFLERFDPQPEGSQWNPTRGGRGRGQGRGRGRGAAELPTPLIHSESILEERHKFRRHCREALGKWILSQKGRDAAHLSYYFPTRQSVAQRPLPTLQSTSHAGTTYDDQLIRDLTMKCTKKARDEPHFSESVKTFIQVTFSLAERCFEAHVAIEEAVVAFTTGAEPAAKRARGESEAQTMSPLVTILSNEQKVHDSQKRIAGDVIEISVDLGTLTTSYASHFNRYRAILGGLYHKSGDLNMRQLAYLTTIVLPRVGWEKLRQLYTKASAADDSKRYAEAVAVIHANSSTSLEALRCATLAYRYEGNLATGSLQLCADETLKELLTDKGYHVVDLCASPINAFNSEKEVAEPTNFCSAFIDTDLPFGSLGSATCVDLQSYMNARRELVKTMSHFLFTLDVPYDEDLCNMLFMKLSDDCKERKIEAAGAFVLVLPLWWDLKFTHTPKVHLKSDDPADVARAVSSAVSYMREGYPIAYPWPEVLGESDWACFDAVFVKDSYSYFCTATNRLLTGVTATEVIGFESPQTNGKLREVLNSFYKL